MAQLALQFVLAHPAVSLSIPGAKRPQQVEENVSASDVGVVDSPSVVAAGTVRCQVIVVTPAENVAAGSKVS